MTIPSVGTTWRASGLGEIDNRFNERGGLAAILIRDNLGSKTNISPWAVGSPPTRGWSPFALDGTPRADLFAVIRVNGEWVTNPNANEGFWLIGANTEDGGAERAPNIKEDDQKVLQSNFPFDTDLTEEGMVVSFTGVEVLKPLMKRLRMNQPLVDSNGNSIVEDPGTENFVIGKPVDVDSIERQIILMFARRKGGKYIYTAEGYSLCKLTDIGSFKRSKTTPDAGKLGFTVLPDSYFMIKDPADPTGTELIPGFYCEWTSGDGWMAIGGAPVFPAGTPTATAGSTGTATIVSPEATGAGDPFTYTVMAKQGSGSFVPATVSTVTMDTPAAGSVTLHLTGLTAGSTIFNVTATGTNGQTATTVNSAAATIT